MSKNPTSKPVIAVVGAGPGIGEAVARRFVAEGFVAALLARTEDKLAAMAQGINRDYGRSSNSSSAQYYPTDVREESSVTASFAKIKQELGPVRVLVYNAGARRINGRSILDTSTEEFVNFTKINLHGAFWSAKAVLPDMLAAGRGTVIFTGATGSLRGSAGLSSFSPGKFGLRSLAQIITREYQPRGIHAAHVIVDGPVDGQLVGGVVRRRWARGKGDGEDNDPDGEDHQEKLANVDAYLMQPADIAKIYWFLHTQPRTTWTHELDVRAQQESMFSKL